MTTPQEVLELEVETHQLGKVTVKFYLLSLLEELWDQGEDFKAKRPFGDSSWDCDIYIPMIKAGMINGHVDEDGYLEDCDYAAGHKLVANAIDSMMQ